MALSQVTYIGNGATQTFSLTFNYISKNHVKVFVNGVEDLTFTFPTSSSVTLTSIPPSGSLVLIKRVTPSSPIVDFVDGSNLTEVMLDTATNQAIYIAQEAFDGVATSDAIADAVTSASVSASNAATSASNASASATSASNSATSASNSAAIAQAAAGTVTPATQAQAEAGTNNTAFMTPLRVFQAIVQKVLDLPSLFVKGNTTLGAAGTDTTTIVSQLQANSSVGTSGQVLTSRGSNLSPQWTDNQAIGVGQTWQNVTGSRAIGTTYTNSTGKPILALISVTVSSSSNANIILNGTAVSFVYGNTASASIIPVTLIIPAGATYSVNINSGSPSINIWQELR